MALRDQLELLEQANTLSVDKSRERLTAKGCHLNITMILKRRTDSEKEEVYGHVFKPNLFFRKSKLHICSVYAYN